MNEGQPSPESEVPRTPDITVQPLDAGLPPSNSHKLGYLKERFKSIMRGQDEVTTRFKDPNSDPYGLRIKRAKEQYILEQKAQIDEKTGLVNDAPYHSLEARLIGIVDRDPNTPPVVQILMDIDNFKAFNSDFGQPAGDEALTSVGKAILETVRDTDTAGRIGGEELAVLTSKTTNPDAQGTPRGHSLAEEIRIKIEKLELKTGRQVTVSIGVAEYQRGEGLESYQTRLNSAERVAKVAGKNRVVEAFIHDGQPLNRDTQTGRLWQVLRDEKNKIKSIHEVTIDDSGKIIPVPTLEEQTELAGTTT